MIYILVFLSSCSLLILWLITVLFKLITSHISDYRVSVDNWKWTNTIIIIVSLLIFVTIKFFYENILFSIIVSLLLVIIIVSLAVFFYHNHYITTGKIDNEKVLKFKKIRMIFAIIATISIIVLTVFSYVYSF